MTGNALSTKEYAKATVTRTAIYRFLSRAFGKEVDGKFITAILEIQPVLKGLADTGENDELEKGCKILLEFVDDIRARYEAEKDNLLTNLAAGYASLFLNVGRKHVALVESVYRGKHHLLCEEPYFEIVQACRILGFEKSESFLEPEDHIAVELELMARLSELTSQNLESGNIDFGAGYLSLQREFLDDHLTKWVPDFAKKLRDASDNRFYTALAYLTEGFIVVDAGFVAYIYEELKKSSEDPWSLVSTARGKAQDGSWYGPAA